MSFVWMSVQTAIISLHIMKWFAYINPKRNICYSEITEPLNIIPINYILLPFVARIKCPFTLQITRCLKMDAYYFV
jgi:hypothetical protein